MCFLLLLIMDFSHARPAGAQLVSGTTRASAGGSPLGSASVLLTNTSGAIIAGTMTSPDGRYQFQLGIADEYRVIARKVGYAPDSSPILRVLNHSTVVYNPTLRKLPSTLAPITIRESANCTSPESTGAATFALWQAVQNALSAEVATSSSGRFNLVLRGFQRVLDPAGSRLVSEKTTEIRTSSSHPYMSVDPETLAVRGFVRSIQSDQIYYAPDARTIISGAFARTHCLRLTRDNAHPRMMGLAFEPITSGGKVEVYGVLWMDSASSALSHLEFRYLKMTAPKPTRGQILPEASGRVDYRSLPNGAWIVSHWVIRVPVEGRTTQLVPRGTQDVSGTMPVRREAVSRVAAVWEVGGDVVSIGDSANSVPPQSTDIGFIRATFADSTSNQKVPGVTVSMSAVADSLRQQYAVTDANGVVQFDSVSAGDYILRAHMAKFDTLYLEVSPIRIQLDPGMKVSVSVLVPSESVGISRLCPSGLAPDARVVHGTVRDSRTSAPYSGVRVVATWLSEIMINSENLSAKLHQLITFSDSTGRYVICGLPATSRLLLRASVGARQSKREPSLDIRNRRVSMFDIGLPGS